MKHHFKKTTRKVGDKNVWRCNNCDSEVVFSEGKTELQVNQYVELAYPKLICVKGN